MGSLSATRGLAPGGAEAGPGIGAAEKVAAAAAAGGAGIDKGL